MEKTELVVFVKDLCELCGKCGKKQLKLQFVENTLLEMERARMNILKMTSVMMMQKTVVVFYII